MVKVQLLKACDHHLPEIVKINDTVQGNPWSPEALRAEIERKDGSLGYVAVDQKKAVVGYLFAHDLGFEAELLVIGVANRAQRQNVGKSLVTRLIADLTAKRAAHVLLEVSAENSTAIHFYKGLGFEIYSTRREYYRDGTDALCMKLKLANPQ